MNTVVTGSVAVDYLMRFPGRFAEHILADQIEHLSVSFLVDEIRQQRGGCAANICYSLGLLGEGPRLMATVGQDFDDYEAWLQQHGVDTSLVRREPDLFTASFFVNTDLEGNQIASFYTGAMARARELCDLRIPYLYDPSQQIVRLSRSALQAGLAGCDLCVVNEYELGLLREKTGLEEDSVLQAPRRACVITLGARGARIWADGVAYDIPGVPPLQAADPTGVGDAFRAGLIKGLALELPWPLAGRVAALAATYSLEQPGPQAHHYTPAEFVSRFRRHFDDKGALDPLAAQF
jgi:adenosine kinase